MRDSLLSSISCYFPELIAILTLVSLLLIVAFTSNEKIRLRFVYSISLIGLITSLLSLFCNLSLEGKTIFSSALTIDSFGSAIKILLVLGTLGAIYLSYFSKDIYKQLKCEFVIMTIGVLIGGMLFASANNLLTFYLGLETLSILSYTLAAMKKDNSKSSEAGVKYILYGGISAGLLLYGMGHIYGILGTIQFAQIAPIISNLSIEKSMMLLPAFLLVFVGVGFKISCFPFHMWAPDVYEGSPLPVTTFFSIVPKLAGMAALVRISMVFFSSDGIMQTNWIGLLQVMSILTITVGNITAIGQRSIKRMLAYSSISHAGMMMLGVVVLDDIGLRSILFYGITYLFMTLVAFYITSFISDKYGNDDHDRFRGFIRRYPTMAIVMAISMFSLTGLPPFSGFIAKFNIISAVINKGYVTLGLLAGLNAVISLYYYMRVNILMILKDPESVEKIEGLTKINQAIIFGFGIPIVVLGIWWDKLIILVGGAKIFLN